MTTPARPDFSASTAARNRRGIAALVAAMAFFATADTLMKVARANLPTGEVMVVRGIFAALCSIGLVIAVGEARRAAMALRPSVLTRGLLEMLVACLFVTAIGHLPLANLTAISQSAPLMIAVYLALTGSESMGWRRWASAIVGFLGVLLVVRPGGEGFNMYTGLAVACAMFVAARDVYTRRIPSGIPTVLILVVTSLSVTVGGAVLSLFDPWLPIPPRDLLLLALAGVFVTGGNFFIIAAFRGVEVGVVAPFRYSIILFAGFSGFVVFGDIPDALAVLGACLIAGSGVYAIHRERMRSRANTR